MPITRKFLGCKQPALWLTAEHLIRRYRAGAAVDMSSAVVVLPGSRAGRRLLEILVECAEQQSLVLTPPTIETVGHLPEQLYRPKLPFAAPLVQQLAWATVLRDAEPERLRPVVLLPPERDDAAAWLDLGELVSRLHTELAADGLDFADVVKRGQIDGLVGEAQRWNALRTFQTAYLRLLDDQQVWDIQTARLVAIKQHECRTDNDITLVGTVDMTITLRRMLDQVADRVTALVFAPGDWADRFDEHGCLVPDAWESAHVPVPPDQVHVVDGSAEQADMVVRRLAEYGGKYRADEITIGLADERITPYVQRQLKECGMASRPAAGTPISGTAPYRLLSAVEASLRSGRYAEFASLVRHADVYAWLDSLEKTPTGWLDRLDQYYNRHLQARLGGAWPGADGETRAVQAVHRRVEGWLGPLRGAPRPLGQWSEPLRKLLLEVYGSRDLDRENPQDRIAWEAFQQINDVLVLHAERIPQALVPTVDAAGALHILLRQLQTAAVSPPVDPEAIELLGWLELPLDDAPALVVCSLNEGFVPSSINSDAFLPNSLRSRLGLQDNARRYARDAYALTALLASRERVDLIVARRTSEGDPLAPSRLLFAAPRDEIARRALRFFAPPTPTHLLPPLAGRLTPGREVPDFVVPRPQELAEPLKELPITGFRDYLACPYRFYLRHVLKLRAVDDAAEELDGAAFGSLLHEVLRQFGSGPCRTSTEPAEIRDFLRAALETQAAATFGEHALASVRVQMEQLRWRLDAFAGIQAEWACAGWQIEHTEVPGRDHRTAVLDVDDKPMGLRGRIDRIDVNSASGVRAILDYKSSDAARNPEKEHQRAGQWVDLQLPLYRHLAHSLGITGPVQLGFVLLPKDVTKVTFCLAHWSDAELAQADEIARDVVRKIRDGHFWRPTEPPPDFFEEFASICQDNVFDKRWEA